jgi:uncharacterized membrane protein
MLAQTLISPTDVWMIWGILPVGVALCIYLEQTYSWAAKTSGPVLALIGGMILSNLKLMPLEAPAYDLVDGYLVPVAVPLLLFRANVVRIVRDSGSMFGAFHIAVMGSLLGAFLASFLFRGAFPRVPEVAGIMSGSYIGGGVNFVALAAHYNVSSELTNPLLVADNFVMAGIFAMLFIISASRFFLRRYPHPHSLEGATESSETLAARHWQRKDVALLDIAKALGIAFAIVAVSMKLNGLIKAHVTSRILFSIIGNPFVLITLFTVLATTFFSRHMEKINGTDELGMYLLYLFFFVIGLRSDLVQVVMNVPVLFAFCLVMALVNLIFTLVVGRFFKLNLEELLLSVNATIGGPPSAAAMAISKGWSKLVVQGLLAGLWGYVIGTFCGIFVTETLKWLGW